MKGMWKGVLVRIRLRNENNTLKKNNLAKEMFDCWRSYLAQAIVTNAEMWRGVATPKFGAARSAGVERALFTGADTYIFYTKNTTLLRQKY